MDVAQSFTYMLRQPGGWGKLLIGGLLLFIPILGWALVGGYVYRALQNTAQGRGELPEWTDFGNLFVTGILVWVGALIYEVPGLILGQLGSLGSLLSSLWGILVFVVFPAALIRFAASDGNFGAFFDFEEIIGFIQNNINNYILAIVMALVASILAMFGLILLVVGVVFTIFWAMLVSAHLYGSVYANRAQVSVPTGEVEGPGQM